jgi:hypothetical protein
MDQSDEPPDPSPEQTETGSAPGAPLPETARSAMSDSGVAVDGSAEATDQRTFWYVETLFFYTNQLMERTQLRCNYLILANSVVAVAFFTIVNALLANRGKAEHLLSHSHALLLVLLPSAMFLCSLVAAVTAFLPRIYESEIELNHEFIARMPLDDYRLLISEKTDYSKLRDFIDEIHVLSRILNDRTRRVDTSARLFIAAVVAMPIVTACTVL